MESIARYHYPPVVWRNGQKKLWNIIHRKTLKNLPEERVRLRIIEFLLSAGWSRHRISTEENIGRMGDSGMRTDIVCYDQQFSPRLLIECKAEYIPITEKTAEQTARYNHKVNAPYLLMTNSIEDYWFSIDNEKGNTRRLNQLPDLLNNSANFRVNNFDYWEKRGFAGGEAAIGLRRWFNTHCNDFWLRGESATIRFLEFDNAPSDLDLNHYYRIISFDKGRKLALTTVGTPYGGSRLVAILNKDKTNISVTEINLDLLFDGQTANTIFYSADGVQTVDIRPYWNPIANLQTAFPAEKTGRCILTMINDKMS